jgi:hypothetical protein
MGLEPLASRWVRTIAGPPRSNIGLPPAGVLSAKSFRNAPLATAATLVRPAPYRRRLQFTVRGGSAGRELNWPSVCLTPAASHGDGLSCVPHANTGVHSNMSDVCVQAVSFIITLIASEKPMFPSFPGFGKRSLR